MRHFLEHTRCAEGALEGMDITPTVALPAPSPHELAPIAEQLRALVPSSGYVHDVARLDTVDGLIDTVRLERYMNEAVARQDHMGIKSAIRQAYYLVRPLLPVTVRKHLQRAALQGWNSIPFPRWPVDTSVEDLMDATWRILLRATNRSELPFIWYWPDGMTAACIMTHDVETAAGRDYCAQLIRMEQRVDIRSAFEIVPEERYDVPDAFLAAIRELGCEICLHGLNHDGRLFNSREVFLERAAKINAYAASWGARGFRSPVMYRNLDWLHELAFSYDMSVPNVAHLDPQRGGCCTVMPYFIGEIVELPLTTIQDYSLFHILNLRSLDLWRQQCATVSARHGLISFIIHPDYVNEPWSAAIYEELLDDLAALREDEGVWIALPRDVDDWWRARRAMRLERMEGRWQIGGDPTGRARVAYAALDGDRVVYRIDPSSSLALTSTAPPHLTP
ncbi:MAG: hypothetical protein KJ018_00120 [Burkholderiales bacterium]|nr:hypothetical protein [Burkholderiales bacterium]